MKSALQKLPIRFFIAMLALCAVPLLAARWKRPTPEVPAKAYQFPTRELAALDRAIQVRFAVVPDKDFGLPRIGQRHSYFYPAIAPEKSAVKDLQKARQEVVFYVVGRRTISKQRNGLGYSPVQGPVYITPRTPFWVKPKVEKSYQARFLSPGGVAKDAPSDAQLISLSRRVFDDAALRNGANQKIGKWNVVARPITASAEQCVDCHNQRTTFKPESQRRFTLNLRGNHDTVSLGDTLGIALYAYRPARKIETKKLSEAEILAQSNQ